LIRDKFQLPLQLSYLVCVSLCFKPAGRYRSPQAFLNCGVNEFIRSFVSALLDSTLLRSVVCSASSQSARTSSDVL
jgi:hypothetical protein